MWRILLLYNSRKQFAILRLSETCPAKLTLLRVISLYISETRGSHFIHTICQSYNYICNYRNSCSYNWYYNYDYNSTDVTRAEQDGRMRLDLAYESPMLLGVEFLRVMVMHV